MREVILLIAVVASVAVLACAVSLDGFGVGVTYGLRKIRIPVVSILIIALCSGLIIWLSMQAGDLLTSYLSELAAKLIGSALLIFIGCWTLLQLRSKKDGKQEDGAGTAGNEASSSEAGVSREGDSNQGIVERSADVSRSDAELAAPPVMMLELKRLGLVIQILRTPQIADVDKSGTISASEAVMLGVALSLDAFGAGIGAAMLGLPSLLTAISIAACSGIFLLCGVHTGYRFANWRGIRALSFLPGILLVVMGIMKLL